MAVRDATPDDVPDLLALMAELRSAPGRAEPGVAINSSEDALARLADVAADPATRLVVAVRDASVAGMALLVAAPLAPMIVDSTSVHVQHLQVREGMRRRGVGRALMAGALAFAEDVGAEHVVASAPPSRRDANRFYARLGMGPLVVRRAATVGALRRRLAAEDRHGLADALARRRSLRTRALLRSALAPAPVPD